MLMRKKLFDDRFGKCSTPKVLKFCRLSGFTKMQLTLFIDGKSVLDLDHSQRINSPSNFRFIRKTKKNTNVSGPFI